MSAPLMAKICEQAETEYRPGVCQQEHQATGRVIGPPCRDGCFNKVIRPVIEKVFKEFWEIGNYDLQNAYLQKIVHLKPIPGHRKTTKLNAPGTARSANLQCTVVYANVMYSVCKAGFLSTFGIKRRMLENAV